MIETRIFFLENIFLEAIKNMLGYFCKCTVCRNPKILFKVSKVFRNFNISVLNN